MDGKSNHQEYQFKRFSMLPYHACAYRYQRNRAGRTDAGVHASMMIAHFDMNIPIADTNKLTANLNSLLPDDIAIQRLWPVANDMHARFSAKSRTYRYQITLNKNPFVVGSATRIIGNLDFDSMNLAAEKILSYTDFTSFSKLH